MNLIVLESWKSLIFNLFNAIKEGDARQDSPLFPFSFMICEVFFVNVLADALRQRFEYIEPMDFYREIFPLGELDEWREVPQDSSEHRYTGILVEITDSLKENGKQRVKRYTVTDDLDEIDGAMYRNSFQVLAPISYVGKSRKSENARIMYALVIELDYLLVSDAGEQVGLRDLIHQWNNGVIPIPTYTVASGNGLHLYYVFERGIPLFPNVVKSLSEYKRLITRQIWNKYTTTDYEEEKIQYESIFQAFRMVGTATKSGDKVQAFCTGERVSIEYMNSFISDFALKYSPLARIPEVYKSDLTLADAMKKYPDWYERRIVRNEPKRHWVCKRDLYDWWKKKIVNEAKVGHRYYCMMMLCIYAIKCDISHDELEQDCLELMQDFETITESDDNHFTKKDVIDALQSFEDKGLVTYPVNSISYRSGIPIQKNKRNGRSQAKHLQGARAIRDINNENWREGNGRKPKTLIVVEWRKANPNGSKAECIRDTGLDKKTVYKWWDSVSEYRLSFNLSDAELALIMGRTFREGYRQSDKAENPENT